MADELKNFFDAYYYAHCCGKPYGRTPEWFEFFGGIADRVVADIQPRKVLDVGCAIGMLVEELRKRGVEAYGVDISEYAIAQADESVRSYCWVGSASEPFPERYDLIVNIEVLEHMPREAAEKAVENMCRHADEVLFSSTPFDYKEATHVNVHPPEYWAELFARQGFYRDVDYDGFFISPWAVRFQKKAQPAHLLVKDYERQFGLLWKENADLRTLVMDMRNENNGLIATEKHLRGVIDQTNAEVGATVARLHDMIGHLNGVVAQRDETIAQLNERIEQLTRADAERVLEMQKLQGELASLYGSRILQPALTLRGLKRKLVK